MTFTIKIQSPDYDGMRVFTGASITSGTPDLTVTDGDFTAADVGRPIIVMGAGTSSGRLSTTVSAVGSTTSITLTANAATTVTSAFCKVGTGSEIALPIVTDRHAGSSLAAIITLFEGDNQILDFKQLREVITLQGVMTPLSVKEAGYTDKDATGIPLFMRDEMRRIRASSELGLFSGTVGTPESWLDEGASGGNWGSTTLPTAEQDSGTSRAPGRIRLVYDKYWNADANAFQNLFLYGTVGDFTFGPRAAASLQDRIPCALTFLVGSVRVN